MNKDMIYNTDVSLNSDICWTNAKENFNNQIEKYTLYSNDQFKEVKSSGSLPSVFAEHANLRGRTGFGLTDDYLVDVYSSLRNDEGMMTRDRCPIQLYTRTFKGGPRLRGQVGDINKELDVLSGSDTRMLPISSGLAVLCSNKTLMEATTNKLPPLQEHIKEVQNADHIVSAWTRGGEDTRSYLSKIKYVRRT
jgi:hypothetical protein